MKKIAAIALLYAVTAMPTIASADNAAPKPNASGAPSSITLSEIRGKFDRLSTLNLLESDGSFSLFGKLSIPRLSAGDEAGMQRNAITYGLYGQIGGVPRMGTQKMGFRFGWNRYLAGPNIGDNLYSLTAVIKF